ncbi:hypothetical protein BU16DRAFT_58222 [Lophium mytilinum]|uniref:Uncharacterized protein n=1 Tax=Lophium mytilinum TaxID=390894 RepID=A0A6A6QP13_9PEZI|nr:hypothetical protein BU16DRAFT_58222 [Lophium mytilinum]
MGWPDRASPACRARPSADSWHAKNPSQATRATQFRGEPFRTTRMEQVRRTRSRYLSHAGALERLTVRRKRLPMMRAARRQGLQEPLDGLLGHVFANRSYSLFFFASFLPCGAGAWLAFQQAWVPRRQSRACCGLFLEYVLFLRGTS